MPLFLAAALLAQTLVESIEVRVVNVDVVVTDKSGKPVTGLTKDDFEILEEKKPQSITNFYEVRNGEIAADAPISKARNFILFVDNRNMHPALRRQVTEDLAKFVDAQFRDGDQATVITWDGVLKIVTPLTGDKAAVRAGIKDVAETGTPTSTRSEFSRIQRECTRNLEAALDGRMNIRIAYEECVSFARQETTRITLFSRMILNALDVSMNTVAGVDGKKVLVMAGTELPVRPGRDIYQWINSRYSPYMRGFDGAIAQPESDEREQRAIIEGLARNANTHGVTLYLISALMPTDNVTMGSPHGIDDAGGDFARSQNTDAAHTTLAKLTGGAAVSMAKAPTLFDTIAADLGSYYSLGYRPATEVKGDRNITVRTKNRSYTVRSRQTYGTRSNDQQMADRTVANVFTPARDGEWPVEIRAGEPKLVEKGKWSVPIEIIAPATAVTLLPREDKLVGGFTVFVAVGNAQGALSTTFRQPNGISITPAEEQGFRATPIVFGATLTVREGESLLSAGIVDQISNVAGFARTTVTATK